MDKKDELTQIVKRVQKDKGQFELLYSQIINRVYFWCFTIIKDEAEAKDVTQEVMLRIYDKVNTLKNPENFISWMYRLTRNYSLNHLDKIRRVDNEFLYDEITGESTEYLVIEERNENIPNEAYNEKETREILARFIENLPRRQREVITLFYLEEMSVDEVANILDYNPGSVRSRLHAGRKNLEEQINDYQEKHNVKLYSASLLPLLLLLLREYRDEVCARQDLSFDKKKFKSKKVKGIPKKVIVISAVVISTVVMLLMFNESNNKNIGEKENINSESKQSLFGDKKGRVIVSGGEVSEKGGKTSITYTFEVADGPLTALHGHLYWDPNLLEFDTTEKDNIKDWVDINKGQLEFMNIDSSKAKKCSITIYFKNAFPEGSIGDEIPIHFEFEDETSINQPERKLVTFAGGDYLAMELDEVIIPVDTKIRYTPNK